MSRLDDLIAELAPEGVRYKAVGEITVKTSNIKWANARDDDEFQYIDLTSVDRVTRRIGDTATITLKDAPSRAQQIVRTGDVIFATTRPTQMRWAVIPPDYDGEIASTGYCVLRPDSSLVLTNFLAHILGADSFRNYVEANQVPGNYPSIPDSRVRAYRIPVPPLEVQREIVRVLDRYAELSLELREGFQAELDARQVQYVYHRDSLLSFDMDGCERLTLRDVAIEFGRGKSRHRPRNDPKLYGGRYPFIQTGDVRNSGHLIREHSQTYNEEGLSQSKLWPRGTVCITIAANIAETGILDFDACFPDSVIGLVVNPDKTSPHYVEYLLQSLRVKLAAKGQGSAQANINLGTFENERFPFPPLKEQERIVSILDKFDAVVRELSIALVSERDARREQYEHYRDKLLTFDEAVA
jgi:type I restriction enzyme S subunit